MSNVCEPRGHQPLYNSVAADVIDIDNTTEQLPDIPCKLVMFQADSANSGTIYLVDAISKTTAGWRLNAGESTPWIPVDDLSRLFAYGSAANQNLRYLALV